MPKRLEKSGSAKTGVLHIASTNRRKASISPSVNTNLSFLFFPPKAFCRGVTKMPYWAQNREQYTMDPKNDFNSFVVLGTGQFLKI